MFVQLALTPAFVVTWRGTWENADSLFDTVLFDGNLVASALTALALGIVGSLPLLIWQKAIDTFAKRSAEEGLNTFRFLLVSRLFTVVRFYFDVLLWKGVWGFYDYIVGASWYVWASD